MTLSGSASEIRYLAYAYGEGTGGLKFARYSAKPLYKVSLSYSTKTITTLATAGSTGTGSGGAATGSGESPDALSYPTFSFTVEKNGNPVSVAKT